MFYSFYKTFRKPNILEISENCIKMNAYWGQFNDNVNCLMICFCFNYLSSDILSISVAISSFSQCLFNELSFEREQIFFIWGNRQKQLLYLQKIIFQKSKSCQTIFVKCLHLSDYVSLSVVRSVQYLKKYLNDFIVIEFFCLNVYTCSVDFSTK